MPLFSLLSMLHCVDLPYFLLVEGHLIWFSYLAITDNAVINVCVQVLV